LVTEAVAELLVVVSLLSVSVLLVGVVSLLAVGVSSELVDS
jgi:hypothetical protein